MDIYTPRMFTILRCKHRDSISFYIYCWNREKIDKLARKSRNHSPHFPIVDFHRRTWKQSWRIPIISYTAILSPNHDKHSLARYFRRRKDDINGIDSSWAAFVSGREENGCHTTVVATSFLPVRGSDVGWQMKQPQCSRSWAWFYSWKHPLYTYLPRIKIPHGGGKNEVESSSEGKKERFRIPFFIRGTLRDPSREYRKRGEGR